MIRRPPRSTRTDTLFPYTTLFRSKLSITANSQMDDITLALDKLPQAVASLDSQREGLVKMLKSLAELSDVGVRVISASKDVTIAALTQLQPVLTEFAKTGDNFAEPFDRSEELRVGKECGRTFRYRRSPAT